ncbi:Tripartite tricarboxylate transporter family receptor [compost metagenome]
MNKKIGAAWLALALAVPTLSQAQAQADEAYPSRAVRFIVPIGPGSSGDTLTRLMAEQFRAVSGQATFVENRPGADLVVGTQNLLGAPADGHSVVLVSNSTMVINPLVIKDLPYKVEDLTPMLDLVRIPAVLVTSPDSRFKTLGDLLEAARKAPGSVSIGVYGNSYRLGALDLARRAGVKFNAIPYKGASQAIADVIGGVADAALTDVGGAAPLIASGKVRGLGVSSGKRHALMPGVPTVQEGGVADYTLFTFIGFAIRAKTPAPIAGKFEALMVRAAADPAFREQVVRISGGEFAGTGREPFSAMIASESVRTRELVKLAGPNFMQ